jgi:hypothetical protein
MARPIKDTPVLRGKAAVKFHNQLYITRNVKASAADFAKIKSDLTLLLCCRTKNKS